MSIAACPNRAQLQALLDGGLSDDKQSELSSHLEGCQPCQATLEGLVAGAQSWEGLAKNLAEPSAEPTEVRRLVQEIQARGDAETSAGEEAGELPSLDFLSPPEKPEQLGKLGHYEVLQLVGRGGMGVVLKAFDPVLHRVVAIKVLAPQLATSANARRRFTREAVAAAAVSHDHVVSIHAVAEANGLPYLVMPYISGLSLQELLDRRGTPELKEVLRIGMQIAAGLSAAHAQGLVHRDIKPANILLENGVQRVKITDFGLARAVDDATLTQSGVLAGTPQYMAPEQARGEAVDARADLFSLGSVLYALCTGHSPFRASTTLGVIKRVCEDPPRAIRDVNADCPEWLSEIINKLLAKSPADRFQSAEEVEDLLKQHLAHLQQPDLAPRPARVTPFVPPHKRRWSRGRTLGTSALLLLAICLAAWWGYTPVRSRYGEFRFELEDPTMTVVVRDEQRSSTVTIAGPDPSFTEYEPGSYTWQAYKDGEVVHTGSFKLVAGAQQIIRVAAAPPKPVAAVPEPAAPTKPDEDMVITDRGPLRISDATTIRLVTVYFQPRMSVIEEKYEADLQQIAQLAAETRDSLLIVQAHANQPDVRVSLSATIQLAGHRATTVRDAVLEIAQRTGAALDPDKVHILAARIGEPAVEKPQNLEQARTNLRVDVRLIRAKPAPPPTKPDEDMVITDRGPLRISEGATIRLVTVYFEPNMKVFEEKYEADLRQIAELAAKTPESVVVVRGHADPTVTLINFVKAGIAKGVLKKERNAAGRFDYQLYDQPFDLSDTAQVLACIEQGVVDGVEPDVRPALSAARQSAQQRAAAVRDALLKIAQPPNPTILNPDRVHILVAGIGAPAIEKPVNIEQARANMRVDVRLIRTKPSAAPRQSM